MNPRPLTTTSCPNCGATLGENKQFCGDCGVRINPLDTRPSTAIGDPRRLLAVVGSALLIIGPFTPLVSVPIMGDLNLMSGLGNSDGLLICGTAVLALVLSLMNRYWCLWISGLFGLAKVGHVFYVFTVRIPTVVKNYRDATAGNPFAGLGELAFGSLHMQLTCPPVPSNIVTEFKLDSIHRFAFI